VESRRAFIVWLVAAVIGSIAVWWLRSYLNELSELAQTDRAAALDLFRTRGVPALLVVVAIAVASGAMLMRQGLQMVNTARDGHRAESNGTPRRPPALMAGWVMASAGFILAAVPLALASVVLWLVRRT
jgi:hypothetical protein